ncbi:MAG: hypothetical protein JWR19_3246 [Pedosphaera sp.]|nr:hypothetical protein [Pedosphaera sp.]
MKPGVLFIITSDPRLSPRPAEALRIAAGVGVWRKADLALYLRDAAVLALSEQPDDLLDEDNYRRYLPLASENGCAIYVQQGAPLLAQIGEPPVRFLPISDEHLAAVAARSHFVLRF